jgi:cell division septal protein FtsQ
MITEKLTRQRKIVLFSIVILYFVVGFFLIILLTGPVLGANLAGILALVYLGLGWYFLIKRNGLFDIMKIKHN